MSWSAGEYVNAERIGTGLVIRIVTAIEYTNAEAVLRSIRAIVDVNRAGEVPDCIAFDCHEVPFVDSSGIGIFIRLHHELTPLGCSIRFFGLTQSVVDVFRYTNLFATFTIVQTQDQALANGCRHD